MKNIGVLLVVLGLLALIYGGFDHYRHDRTLVKIGSAEIMTSEGRDLQIPFISGAVVLLGGIALLAGSKRRGRSI